MRETVAKIDKTKSLLFEMINKTDKLLARHQGKTGEHSNQ